MNGLVKFFDDRETKQGSKRNVTRLKSRVAVARDETSSHAQLREFTSV